MTGAIQEATRLRSLIDAKIPPEVRKSFYETSWVRSVWQVFHVWLGLAVSFLVILALPGADVVLQLALAPLLVLYIGARLNAFGVLVHEASHRLLMDNRAVNDAFCNFFAAYWVLNDVQSYRSIHKEHHAKLLEDDDPDRPLYALGPRGKRRLAGFLIQDLLWITAAKRILEYLRAGKKSSHAPKGSLGHTAGKLGAQAAVAALFVGSFGLWPGAGFFLLFWVVPLFSVFPVIVRIRIVAEHYEESEVGQAMRFVSRTSFGGFLERYLIGAGMEFHMEHHLYPNIPHHQLRRMHRYILASGILDSPDVACELVDSGGYARYWRELVASGTPCPAAAPTGVR